MTTPPMSRLNLNPSQLAVVRERSPRIIVMAGAGTGKTATTVHYVASLIREGLCRSRILMITFTRKAANEMSRRVKRLVADIPEIPGKSMMIGTYHAVGIHLLREDPRGFGFPGRSFTVIDDSETLALWKSAYKECGIPHGDSLCQPSVISALISWCHNTCTPLERGLQKQWHGQEEIRLLLKVHATYQRLKRTAHAVDYDDILVLLKERLENDALYRGNLRARFTHVLVDEVQDNSQLNYAILKNLDPHHLMVVGDVQQSIYGFRGASSGLIAQFAREGNATILKLEDNFRSGQKILDLANRIVSGEDFSLKLRAARDSDSLVDCRVYSSPQAEAEGIVNWINHCVLKRGMKPCDVAVLSRSSVNLTLCEAYLKAHRISYKKYGGLSLGDAAEVKDFISFLRVLVNRNDRLAMTRALTQFPGLGETAAKSFATGMNAEEGGEEQLFEVISWPRQAREMELWLGQMRQMDSLADIGGYLKKAVTPLFKKNYAKDWEKRMETIESIVQAMGAFQGRLEEFLDAFLLEKSDDKAHPENCVVLSTIHSSKGLEWPAVFVMGSGSRQMPHPRVSNDEEVAEERRLMYVAVTRARDRLVVSYPQTHGRQMEPQLPSPLLPEDIQWRPMDNLVQAQVLPPKKEKTKPNRAMSRTESK
ncbi:ATP-dependent helicase [Kamptonema cortianum]|nr:ATP-dependent helicase [Kamptonema cortianum]